MSARLFEVDVVVDSQEEEGQVLAELKAVISGDPEGRVWLVTPGPNGWPTAFVRVSGRDSLGRLAVWADGTGQGSLKDMEIPADTPLPFHRPAR